MCRAPGPSPPFPPFLLSSLLGQGHEGRTCTDRSSVGSPSTPHSPISVSSAKKEVTCGGRWRGRREVGGQGGSEGARRRWRLRRQEPPPLPPVCHDGGQPCGRQQPCLPSPHCTTDRRAGSQAAAAGAGSLNNNATNNTNTNNSASSPAGLWSRVCPGAGRPPQSPAPPAAPGTHG